MRASFVVVIFGELLVGARRGGARR